MTLPSRLRNLVMACAITASATVAAAQTDLTAISTTTYAYNSLPNWTERSFRPAGVVDTIQVDGHQLVNVRLVLDGPWSDEIDRVQIRTRDIRLILPDGTELEARGGFQYWGQFTRMSPSVSGRRPRNFPDEDQDIHWNGVFIVPNGVTSATLRMGGEDFRFEGPVTISKITTVEDPASFADFRVTSMRRFRSAELEDGSGSEALTSTLSAPAGYVLAELEVEVVATAGNQADGDARFNWHTNTFRLVDGQGASMGLVGERFIRRVLDTQFNGVNAGDSAERTMLFLVPETQTNFQLLFGETPVTTVDLSNAAITDTD